MTDDEIDALLARLDRWYGETDPAEVADTIRDLRAERDDARAQLAAATEREAALREALEPFAAYAAAHEHGCDGDVITGVQSWGVVRTPRVNVTLGDFRRAIAACERQNSKDTKTDWSQNSEMGRIDRDAHGE